MLTSLISPLAQVALFSIPALRGPMLTFKVLDMAANVMPSILDLAHGYFARTAGVRHAPRVVDDHCDLTPEDPNTPHKNKTKKYKNTDKTHEDDTSYEKILELLSAVDQGIDNVVNGAMGTMQSIFDVVNFGGDDDEDEEDDAPGVYSYYVKPLISKAHTLNRHVDKFFDKLIHIIPR